MPGDAAALARARQAMDKAWAAFGSHPDVRLVDVGSADDGHQTYDLAIRIHTNQAPEDFHRDTPVPSEIDGVPVVVISGDYRIER